MSVVKGNGMEECLKRVEKKGEGLMDEIVLCVSMPSISPLHLHLVHSHIHQCVMQKWCFSGLCGGWCLVRKRQSGDCVVAKQCKCCHPFHPFQCVLCVCETKMAWASSAFPHHTT